VDTVSKTISWAKPTYNSDHPTFVGCRGVLVDLCLQPCALIQVKHIIIDTNFFAINKITLSLLFIQTNINPFNFALIYKIKNFFQKNIKHLALKLLKRENDINSMQRQIFYFASLHISFTEFLFFDTNVKIDLGIKRISNCWAPPIASNLEMLTLAIQNIHLWHYLNKKWEEDYQIPFLLSCTFHWTIILQEDLNNHPNNTSGS